MAKYYLGGDGMATLTNLVPGSPPGGRKEKPCEHLFRRQLVERIFLKFIHSFQSSPDFAHPFLSFCFLYSLIV